MSARRRACLDGDRSRRACRLPRSSSPARWSGLGLLGEGGQQASATTVEQRAQAKVLVRGQVVVDRLGKLDEGEALVEEEALGDAEGVLAAQRQPSCSSSNF